LRLPDVDVVVDGEAGDIAGEISTTFYQKHKLGNTKNFFLFFYLV
jgi:hypothetical protein